MTIYMINVYWTTYHGLYFVSYIAYEYLSSPVCMILNHSSHLQSVQMSVSLADDL